MSQSQPNPLSLIASNDVTTPAQGQNEYSARAAYCLHALGQTKDPQDRAFLRGVAQIWEMLAECPLAPGRQRKGAAATAAVRPALTALVVSQLPPQEPEQQVTESDGIMNGRN
jgi:hypothetical protein